MKKQSMDTIRGYSKKDLQGKIRESRGELAKLRVVSVKGTLKKDSGRLRPIRRDIARMETRMTEMRRDERDSSTYSGGTRVEDDE